MSVLFITDQWSVLSYCVQLCLSPVPVTSLSSLFGLRSTCITDRMGFSHIRIAVSISHRSDIDDPKATLAVINVIKEQAFRFQAYPKATYFPFGYLRCVVAYVLIIPVFGYTAPFVSLLHGRRPSFFRLVVVYRCPGWISFPLKSVP